MSTTEFLFQNLGITCSELDFFMSVITPSLSFSLWRKNNAKSVQKFKKKVVEQKFVLNEYSYHDGIQKGDMDGVYHSYDGN